MLGEHELWIFAYGSLMWRPGFSYEEVVHAKLVGWQRRFCIYSRYHRGSPRRPGIVLGLDRGGVCEGLAFRVSQDRAAETLQYLREREQVISVYREALVPITLMRGDRPEVLALAYLVERAHPSYAGQLSLASQAQLIRGARGRSGDNIAYFLSTLAHLDELDIRERELERLVAFVGPHLIRGELGGRRCAHAAALTRGCRRMRTQLRRLRPEDARRFNYRDVLLLQPKP